MAIQIGDLVVIGKYDYIGRIEESSVRQYDSSRNQYFRFILVKLMFDFKYGECEHIACQDYQVTKISKVHEEHVIEKFKKIHKIEEEKFHDQNCVLI